MTMDTVRLRVTLEKQFFTDQADKRIRDIIWELTTAITTSSVEMPKVYEQVFRTIYEVRHIGFSSGWDTARAYIGND